MKIYSKALIIFLGITIIFVFSGLGILAMPKPAKAWPVFDWKKLIENVLLAIWKFAIYPLLQKIIITAITKGDWFLTEEELKKWAIQDLAFQTANAVFSGITGVTLCASINQNIKLGLSKLAANLGKYTPSCTYDRSELVSIMKADPEKQSELIRKKLFQSIAISTVGANNDVGLSFEAFGAIVDKAGTKKDTTKNELSLNGLLTTRDCSCDVKYLIKSGFDWGSATKKVMCDADGKMVSPEFRPAACKKKTIDGELAATIKKNGGAAGDQFGQTLKSQVLLDLIVLAKMAVSSAVETHVMNPLQKWLASHLVTEQPTLAPSYSRSGENRLIEYPLDGLNLDNTLAPPDLLEETP